MGVVTELLVKANDQAGLTYEAVNVEQTVPGKPSPNDRSSQKKNKAVALTRILVVAAWPCFIKTGNKRQQTKSREAYAQLQKLISDSDKNRVPF